VEGGDAHVKQYQLAYTHSLNLQAFDEQEEGCRKRSRASTDSSNTPLARAKMGKVGLQLYEQIVDDSVEPVVDALFKNIQYGFQLALRNAQMSLQAKNDGTRTPIQVWPELDDAWKKAREFTKQRESHSEASASLLDENEMIFNKEKKDEEGQSKTKKRSVKVLGKSKASSSMSPKKAMKQRKEAEKAKKRPKKKE
jgi:hypothetical protein